MQLVQYNFCLKKYSVTTAFYTLPLTSFSAQEEKPSPPPPNKKCFKNRTSADSLILVPFPDFI